MKSWGTFAKNARAADAIEESGRFTLTPTKNLGPKDGFVDDPRSAMVLDSPNPEALGVALKRVLGASS